MVLLQPHRHTVDYAPQVAGQVVQRPARDVCHRHAAIVEDVRKAGNLVRFLVQQRFRHQHVQPYHRVRVVPLGVKVPHHTEDHNPSTRRITSDRHQTARIQHRPEIRIFRIKPGEPAWIRLAHGQIPFQHLASHRDGELFHAQKSQQKPIVRAAPVESPILPDPLTHRGQRLVAQLVLFPQFRGRNLVQLAGQPIAREERFSTLGHLRKPTFSARNGTHYWGAHGPEPREPGLLKYSPARK
uniref:Uncharacterized protein n=1 Tax=Anopheles merus TaxID=30066 RepID=A0A182V0Q5_ANOME